MRGELVKWDANRNFGFIRVLSERRADVFVHLVAFRDAGLREPRVGDMFEFDITEDRRHDKPKAVRLRRA